MATVVGALLASQIASLRMVDHPMQDGIPIASQRRSHSNLTSHETSLAASCIKATPPRTAWFAMRDPARPSDHPVSSKIHQNTCPTHLVHCGSEVLQIPQPMCLHDRIPTLIGLSLLLSKKVLPKNEKYLKQRRSTKHS